VAITACLVLGLCASIGIWAREAMERAQRGEVARIYAAALTGRRDPRIDRGGDATRMESLGLALGDLIRAVRHATFGRDSLASNMIDGGRSIETSRQLGKTVIASMEEDAHAIAAAAQGSRDVERTFATCLESVRAKAESAETATSNLAGEAEALAGGVRAITAQTEKATLIATRLAETAFATQRGVSSIGEAASAMFAAADQVQTVLQRTELAWLNAGIEANRAGDEGRGLGQVVGDVKDLARAGGAALEQMLVTVRDLKQHTAQISARLQELSDVVQTQHEFGHALSHAAMLQADLVGRVLRQISAAHGDVKGLNAQIRDMALPQSRLGVTPAAQEAVERLPGYADAMAQILRGLPDFSVIEKA
jgi:methyl-accepting chemotaxis protein